ncbi:hypothetical protein D3C85_1396390 [compost metagenome]
MIAFDEQLRLAEYSYIDTGRTLPDGFAAIRAVPVVQILYPTFNVVEKVFLGRSKVLRVFQAACRVAATENGGIDLQH